MSHTSIQAMVAVKSLFLNGSFALIICPNKVNVKSFNFKKDKGFDEGNVPEE
jgi:hypothetical protein